MLGPTIFTLSLFFSPSVTFLKKACSNRKKYLVKVVSIPSKLFSGLLPTTLDFVGGAVLDSFYTFFLSKSKTRSRLSFHILTTRVTRTSWGWAGSSSSFSFRWSESWGWNCNWSLSSTTSPGSGWVVGGWTKTKLMLNSTQVEVEVEVGVELGNCCITYAVILVEQICKKDRFSFCSKDLWELI